MATIIATAGGGNWNATTTWVGGVVPNGGADVQLNATSGNVTINVASACRSLDCTGYTGTLTHVNPIQLTVGTNTPGLGNIALKLDPGMTYSIGGASTTISFSSTSTTQQTITSGGIQLSNVTIAGGANGSYIFADPIAMLYNLTMTGGSLDTGSQSVSCGNLSISGSGVVALTLGSSAIMLSSTVSFSSTATITVTPNSAVLTLTATATPNINVSGLNMQGLSLVAAGGSIGLSGGTFLNVTVNGIATKTCKLTVSGPTTITGTLTAVGNSIINRIVVSPNSVGVTPTVVTAAVAIFANADFRDVTAAGTAAPFTGTSIGDMGGNADIIFDAPTTRYAVVAGNWSSTATWSDSSGGAPGASFPLPQDTVFLDANSGIGTITTDINRLGADIDTTGYTGTLRINTSAESYGSLKIDPTTALVALNQWTLAGRQAHTITSGLNKTFASIILAAPGGTYDLLDNLTSSASLTNNQGTFNTNNLTLNVQTIAVSGTTSGSVVNFGDSTVNIIANTGGTIFTRTGTGVITAGTATFNIKNTYGSNRSINLGAGDSSLASSTLNYTIRGSVGSLTLTIGSIGTLNFYDTISSRALILPNNSTTAFTKKFYVHGFAGIPATIQSATAGIKFTLSLAGGVVSVDFLSIRDSTATGGATWYAGRNSTDVSNNTGWIFDATPTTGGFMPLLTKG